MATVFLAHDLKHARRVAIKVLKPQLAAAVGPERFLAEVQTTAQLTHPNVLPLHDSGDADGLLFYVMPYVEGESVRDRLDREGQLPVAEAVRIATGIAEALDYAHRQGVIHRDIKPANVLLQDGNPVLADFGIALAVLAGVDSRLTGSGLTIGTPHYMSPEQATGEQRLSNATDIYSLGCVLYEMLVGEPPFTGATNQAIVAQIVSGGAVSAAGKRPSVPTNVDAVIRRALERIPADRFTRAGDVAAALRDASFRPEPEVTGGHSGRERFWKQVAVGLAGMAAVTSGLALWFATQGSVPESPAPVRFTVSIDEDWVYGDGDLGLRPEGDQLAISPDGETIVFAAAQAGMPRLFRLDLNDGEIRPTGDTEGGELPFFSPDGAWIGFAADGVLLRLPMGGGAAETIARARPSSATWGDDDHIVFVEAGIVYRVPATGGEPVIIAERPPDIRGSCRYWREPHLLPGSRTVLLHGAATCLPEDADIVALDVETGTRTTVLADAMNPRFVHTGHLLFMRRGALMAVRFDLETLETRGQPVVMVEDVMHAVYWRNSSGETGSGQIALSRSGHLAYARGGVAPALRRAAIRITAQGDTLPLPLDTADHIQFRASPDGQQIAFVTNRGPWEVWIHELARGVTQRLAIDGYHAFPVAWSPDGRSIAFNIEGEVWTAPADGASAQEVLAGGGGRRRLQSWSPNGDLAWLRPGETAESGEYQEDIWIMSEAGEEAPLFESRANEAWATFSPDGRWIAYASNASGRNEVYVRSYPAPGPVTQVSSGGGVSPVWSPDGRRIVYVAVRDAGRYELMGVDIAAGDVLRPGRPQRVLETWDLLIEPVAGFDFLPDGSLVTAAYVEDRAAFAERSQAKEIHVVLNWIEELKARLPR